MQPAEAGVAIGQGGAPLVCDAIGRGRMFGQGDHSVRDRWGLILYKYTVSDGALGACRARLASGVGRGARRPPCPGAPSEIKSWVFRWRKRIRDSNGRHQV